MNNLQYDEVKHRFDRGDYNSPDELKAVKSWLHKQEKEREFIAACQRASISAALDAGRASNRANLIALLALVVSIIGARTSILELFNLVKAGSGN